MIKGVCHGDRTLCEAKVAHALFWYLSQRGPLAAAVAAGQAGAPDLLREAQNFARDTARQVVAFQKSGVLAVDVDGVKAEIVWTVHDVTGGADWEIRPK